MILRNEIDSKLYRDRNINARNSNYQKQNVDISRVCGNIASFPTRYISHEKHKYAPICIPRDMQLAMRIFINRMPLPPLSAMRTWMKRNTHGVGIPLNLIPDIFSLPLRLFYISLSALLLLLPHTCAQILCCKYYCISFLHVLDIFPYVSLLILFFSVTWILRIAHVFSIIYPFSPCLPFSLFVSLFFVSCFWSGSLFMRIDTSCTSCISFSRIATVFPTSRRAFPLSNSRQFLVCRRSYYTPRLSHSRTIRDYT